MITSMTRSLVSSKQWYRSMLAGNDAYSPGAYELISTTVLGSSQATVTFDVSTYASTYKHLQIRYTGRSNRADTDSILGIRFNSATTNYRHHMVYGNGSTVISATSTDTYIHEYAGLSGNTAPSNTFAAGVIDILDPFSSSKNTTIRALVGQMHSSYPRVSLNSGAWFDTAVVTSISCTDIFSTMVAGSRLSIYGLKG